MWKRGLPKRFSTIHLPGIPGDCESACLAEKNQATWFPQTTDHFPGVHEWEQRAIGEGCRAAQDRAGCGARWKGVPALRNESPAQTSAERRVIHHSARCGQPLRAGPRDWKRRKGRSPRVARPQRAIPCWKQASRHEKRPWSLIIRFSGRKAWSNASGPAGESVRGDVHEEPLSHSTARGRHYGKYRPFVANPTRPRTRTKLLDFRVETCGAGC